jgi:hypothetical protein
MPSAAVKRLAAAALEVCDAGIANNSGGALHHSIDKVHL